ncbi:DUF1963 domain-containing protein [Deinococcus sp.]|uniref:DUF1963 domain-containing protein n=1 Tax=Deinococcus sp. TaxID=47478 RepID=UPI003C7B69AA
MFMTEQERRRLIGQHGLGAVQDLLMGHMRPTVYLTLGEPGEEAGVSRIAGRPDLPADLDWPADEEGTPLTFLLQIRLKELPAFGGNPLPGQGLLSVFVGLDEPASDVSHAISLFGHQTRLERRLPAGETANETFAEVSPHRLIPKLGWDLPHWATSDHEKLVDRLSAEQQEAYERLGWALEPEQTLGRLLGHAAGIGSDPREDAYVVREVDPEFLYNYTERANLDMGRALHWQHLLTISSTRALNLTIWDAGYLQFLIRDTALAARDFGEVYASVQTS